jgi:hypothetical protein
MNRETIKKMAVISIFWGALWGITEATLGYLAHLILILPGIAGFFMFPIGFYFMTRAYKETGKAVTLFSTSAVAAGIKLIDLFLPGLSPIKTINPAVCILMESLVVILLFKVMNVKRGSFRLREAFAASIGWRLGYLFYAFLLFVFSISREFFQMGAEHILRFLLLESIINAVIITAYLKAEKSFNRNKKPSLASTVPSISFAVLTAAILVKLMLASS